MLRPSTTLAATAALLFALAGCGDQSVTTQPDEPAATGAQEATTGAQEPAAEQQPSPTPAATEKKQATVGDTITLAGNDPGLQMAVTVRKVLNPAEPANQFLEPESGNHFVAIQLGLENVGEANYSDSPSNGAQLIDAQGQQYSPSIMSEVQDCQAFAGGSVTVAPGDNRTGCIVFEVPDDTGLRSFQFTLDSGFGPETGVWTIN